MLSSNILLCCFIALCLWQILYFVFLSYPNVKPKKKNKSTENLKIDFIIAVKNEVANLESLVDALQQQDIFTESNSVRIIIVNDHSQDGTFESLKKLEKRYPHLVVNLQLPEGLYGKKEAIKLGIKHASDYVLMLDADCRPATSSWASIMMQNLTESEIVLGYGPFFKESGLLNRLIRFDCMWIATQYFGWSQKGKPYMGVGRNMAVKTSVYKSLLPLVKGTNLISGDDDLLLQAASGRFQVKTSTDCRSFVYSSAEDSYGSYLRQKTRQITTSYHYKFYHQLCLGLDSAVKILWPILLVLVWILMPLSASIFLSMGFVMIQFITHYKAVRTLHEKDLYLFIPLLVLLYGMHLSILALNSLTSRDKIWK